MKKINQNLLADVSLEMTPLTENNEGQLRGGFAECEGNEISSEAQWNVGCVNECETNSCVNIFCHNKGCGTTTTSTTSGTNSQGLSLFL